MSQSSEVVVLAASRATHVVVLDVLRDWSELGLIDRVHLVDLDAIRPGDLLVPAIVLDQGRTHPVVLQEELSARTSTAVARVCVLSEVGAEVVTPPASAGTRLVELVTQSLLGVPLVRLHVIGTALQGAQPSASLAWLGWHNIVISPENSQGPTSGVAPLVFSPGDSVRISHFVAAVCSMGGLWATQPQGPLDDRRVPPGSRLLAARTFSRHLSAQAVESELFSRLADVSHGYPVPLVEGQSAWQVDDQVQASTDMAEQLLTKYPDLLPKPRQMPVSRPPKQLTAGEAFRRLWGFLLSAIANAPMAFARKRIQEINARTASLVQGMVFGQGASEYEVVVNGVRPDGTPASWSEIDESAERAGGQVRTAVVQFAPVDLTACWKDFVGAGLTLLDAGTRSPDLPPRMSGSRVGIVTQGGRVVPDPADVFVPPGSVSAYIKRPRVTSNDPFTARNLVAELTDVSTRQPHVAAAAQHAGSSLKEWFGNHERSYSGRIGLRIAQGIANVRDEIVRFTQALQGAEASSDIPAQIEAQQRRLTRRLQLYLGLALVAIVAVVLVTVLGPPGWLFLAIALAIILVGWTWTSTIAFMRGQRDLFALLHRREELAAQIEIIKQHLQEALDDLRRLTRAYRQYLDWSAAFGRFVAAPMGRPPALVDDEVVLGSGFPLNHRFGAARPDPAVLDETATRLRRYLFGVGWAGTAWASFLESVPGTMGGQAYRVQDDPDVLYSDPGVAAESLLTAWSAAVCSREDWSGATDTLRERVDELMRTSATDLGPRLMAQVETRGGHGELQTVAFPDFVNQLDTITPGAKVDQQFQRYVFGDVIGDQPWRIDDTVPQPGKTQFGRTIVVTQLSDVFAGHAFRLTNPDVGPAGATSDVGRPDTETPHF